MILNEQLVCLKADVKTAEEAILLAAEKFERLGYVTKEYGQAVISRELIYPTGLKGNGYNIAIPHTDPIYVKKPGIAVIIPKEPVRFRMMGTPDTELQCEMIFPLAMEKPEKQLQLLMKLMEFLQNDKKLGQVFHAKHPEEVISIMNDLEI